MICNKSSTLLNWIKQNKKLINIAFVIIIIIRFVYLNYINWNWGDLATGYEGVKYGCDTERYINGAEQLINNNQLLSHQTRYVGYILLIAFVKMLGFGLKQVILIQLLMALLSSLALYDIGKSITKNPTISIIGAGLYLINPFIVNWHLYIHTESIYFSFLIFATWSINKAIQKKTYNYFILSFLIVIVTASIRPNGWVLVPIMFCFFIFYSNFKRLLKFLCLFLIPLIFFFSTVYFGVLNRSFKDNPIVQQSQKGLVIYGHDELCIVMPKDISIESNNWIKSYFVYTLKHPIASLKLATVRVFTEFLQINRSWLSVKYKIRFLFWMLPSYLLAIIGIIYYRHKAAMQVIFVIVLSHIMIIALTHSEHEFRFMTSILSLIHVMGACGIFFIIKKYFLLKIQNSL